MVKVVDQEFSAVAARYPFNILINTAAVWAHTVGADDTAEEIEENEGPRILETETGDDARKRELLRWLELHAEASLDRPDHPHDMPMETAFDAFIPWVAAVINHSWTRYEAAALRLGLDPGDGFILPPAIRAGWSQAQSLRRPDVAFVAGQDFKRYRAMVVWLSEKTRLLAEWATAKQRTLPPDADLDDLEDLAKTARNWAQKQARKAPVIEGTVLHTFPDGWTMQLLDTEEALEYEGEYLRHCVADHAELGDPHRAIYSLRDPKGKPVVTIEHDLAEDEYTQVKAFTNDPPTRGQLLRVACFRIENDPPDLPAGYMPPTEDSVPWNMWKTGHGDEIAGSDAAQEFGIHDELIELLIDQQFWRWYDVCKPVWWQ